MGEGKLDIGGWRDEIDRIDEELVRLLNDRSKCAIEIGRLKREIGQPVYSPARETQVLEHVTGVNAGPLDDEGIRRLFERIIDESRRIERVTVELEMEGRRGPAVKASYRKKRRAR
jgi:chorismate mutase